MFTVHSLDRVEYEHGVFLWHWETQETAIAAADRVIAISQSEKALMLEYCPNVRNRVRVVGNGISDTKWHAIQCERETLELSDRPLQRTVCRSEGHP